MSSSSDAPGALILGLGNPGPRYQETRHNLGFLVVEAFAARRGLTFARRECDAWVAADAEVMLALPQTFMNRSGYAARCLVEQYHFALDRVLVVYDEVALPLGRTRLRPAGSPGGHRGMESVIEGLASDQIARLRLGCGRAEGPPAGEDLVEYVLSPFGGEELPARAELIERGADACAAWLAEGVAAAMNRFNAG